MSMQVTVRGRLTRDPELRFTNGGKAIAQFSVATSRRTKDDDGQWVDTDVSFWDCTAFGEMAEKICEDFRKGHAVLVVGAMRQESWEKDGQKKYAWRVLVDGAGPDYRWVKPAGQKNDSYNDEPPF